MINAQLKLIVPIFLSSKNRYEILSISDTKIEFPSISVEPFCDLHATMTTLISRHIAETADTRYKLIDIDITDSVNIYYLSFVNYDATILSGYTHPIDINNNILPINAKQTISLLIR